MPQSIEPNEIQPGLKAKGEARRSPKTYLNPTSVEAYLPSDLHLMEVLHNPCDPWFLVWLATCVSFSTLCKSSRGLCYAN